MDAVAVTIAADDAGEVLPVARPTAEPTAASNSTQQPSFIPSSAVQKFSPFVPSSLAADLRHFVARRQVW